MAKPKKPVYEVELDDETAEDAVEYSYAKCVNDISEIMARAYQEIEARVRTLVDESKSIK